jgi:pimeloyl-ACP methyl ester carboxylesterase
MPRPFQRVPFDDLPEAPRVPHDYASTEGRTLAMRSRPFGEIEVHYREHGAGPPLLLVHGLMTTSYSWRYVVRELGKRFRVVAPDLPGAGRTSKPTDRRYDAAALVEWIGELQEALSLRGCAAVGNSLGGFLCLLRALADPGAFSRLVDIHSPAAPDARYVALHAALAVPGVRAGLARFIRRDPARWAWRNVHYYDETLKSREEAREYGAPLATREGALAFTRWLGEAMAPAGFAGLVRKLEARRGEAFPIPLLLLYSREDALVPPRNGDILHALVPDARLTWIEKSSHFAHVDTPDAVLREVMPFLTE